ncbi:Transcriptional regulator of ribosomal biogenesis protein [Haplosporangium bisporale]|nr:Transcriptional regulator of ribosomal biogenesis protein [Haplosporangium bisporale]
MPAPIEIQSPRLKQLHQQFSTSRQSTPLIQQYPYLASAFEFDSDFGARVFPGSPLADNTRAREFETAFCRDFYCCGLVLVDLHDLLQHYEECHVRFEEDEDDLAEQESEFLDDDSWSDSDSTPSSPSSSSALGSGLSSSGSGSGSRSDSSVTASLGPYQTRKTHSPLSHHQTLFHGYHLHPLQITDPNNSLVAPYLNSTTHAVEAFSSSCSGPNKRKAVVSLADIYAEDDNSDDLQGCDKSYKNPNGLKYHNLHGHCSSSGLCGDDNPENKPYVCTFLECGKRYKNLNGLKYHIEHSHPNLIAALRAHHSGLTNPLLFGPYPNQAAMTIAAALAAVETSPMMLAAANAILTSASNAAAAANAASSSSNTAGGGSSGVGGQTTSGSNGGVPTPAPHGHVAAANMMSPIQTATPVVSIAPAMPLVRTIKDIAVPIGTVGGAMTAVPTLASLNDED